MTERGLYQRGKYWGISYFHEGQHVRRMIGTKGEARKELSAIRAKIDGRTFQPPRQDSFADLADAYDAEQSSKAGYESERYYIVRVRDYFAKATVQDIGVEDVEKFRDWLTAEPKKNGGTRSGIDINHHLRVLHAILNKAVLRDWITKNPADAKRVKRPPKGNGREQHLSIEEAGRLLSACTPHLYSLVLCQLETGMRVEEADGLLWSEIRPVALRDGTTRRMIHLPAERVKTRQARKVPVTHRLAAHLDALREAQKADRVPVLSDLAFRYPKPRIARKQGARSLHLIKGPLSDTRGAWKAALRKAGLSEDLQRRDLRRTFRTHIKMKGADSFLLNEVMGHGNPTIEKTYTQVSDEALFAVMELVPDWNPHGTSTKLAHFEHWRFISER